MSLAFPGDPLAPRRRRTREVAVGDVVVGGDNPIRIQSMTTTDTLDVAATVAQCERLAAAGCEIVRITAPSQREAEALREIRAELDGRGVRVPLVADIHFTPKAALIAAEAVEKVRINPGNFADKKKFEVREYSDAQYGDEIERVADRFRPLVRRCKELGRAMRIGTNHGSLSDRIMNRYGDSAQGMVESALEFLRVCEDEGFGDVIFSMKASNTQVAIQAYRLLAARLDERAKEGLPGDYPLHVGVTEAGDGEDGRTKSAIGIGSLLLDGLGDTIRVSLTEDPVKEVPVARALARRAEARWATPLPAAPASAATAFVDDPFEHRRRETTSVVSGSIAVGGDAPVRAELELGVPPEDAERAAWALGDALATRPELACEALRVDVSDESALARARAFADALAPQPVDAPLVLRLSASLAPQAKGVGARWVIPVDPSSPPDVLAAAAGAAASNQVTVEWQLSGQGAVLGTVLDHALTASRDADLASTLLSVDSEQPVPAVRLVAAALRDRASGIPLVLASRADPGSEADSSLLYAAMDLGSLLCDGLGDAVTLPAGGAPADALARIYRILQGARLRTTWTEFISCPSCGRTLFDLEETTARIKERTDHLKGVKIAIMGCIVNGPGEMADADFGYVGSGPGVVNLYVGQDCVERHLPQDGADDRLVALIKSQGAWTPRPTE